MLQTRVASLKNLINLSRRYSMAQVQEDYERMQAWQVHSFGEELQLCTPRIPVIRSPTDLLVEVQAASVNPIDIAMKGGYGRTIMKVFRCQNMVLPLTLGRDFCGKIIDKGANVGKEFNVGETVYGFVPFSKEGSHASYALVNKNHVKHKPDNINEVEAASLPYSAVTAWCALWFTGGLCFRDISKLKILVLGASGGVGTNAVQMLKASGATVIASCSQNAIPLVQTLGADLVLDYRDPCYIQNVASQGKYDIILDLAKNDPSTTPPSWDYRSYITLDSPLLRNMDNYGLIGGTVYSAASLIPRNICNITQGRLLKWAYFMPLGNAMEFVDNLVKRGKLRPVINKVYPFSQTPDAYNQLSEGHARGKIVLDMRI